MKIFEKIALFCCSALLMASCEKDEGVFTRENDAITCDCTE